MECRRIAGSMDPYAIGIDLGTTYSCVSVYRNGKLEIIANDCGFYTTPSCVAFTDEEVLVGNAAKDQVTQNPENTIYDIKRVIGRRFDDAAVQANIKNLPYILKSDKNNCLVQINTCGEEKTFTPEDISAMILKKMKEIAETILEREVKNAVITVPAYFNDSQRQATINAANLAGLQVLRIVNEPTAAAIAYDAIKEDISGTFLVFDMGGGTLDVSIVNRTGSRLIIKSTNGNTNFGGEDITNNLVEYFADLFEKKHQKCLCNNKRALQRLRKECESVKQSLSFKNKAAVCVDGILDGIDLMEDITQTKFNSLCEALFKSVLDPVKKALESADIAPVDINKVIMVGGSSRIPKLQSLLQDFFTNAQICMSINPDEAIAYGAGIFAAMLSGVDIKDRSNLIIQDVTPMSLITDVVNGVSLIVPRNSILPISKSKTYKTVIDNQAVIHCNVYEGDTASSENFLGLVSLTNIPRAPAGREKCQLTFSVDENGVLKYHFRFRILRPLRILLNTNICGILCSACNNYLQAYFKEDKPTIKNLIRNDNSRYRH
ncbi:putative heat shock cognate 71 kDa [Trypoxylus dichotomus]